MIRRGSQGNAVDALSDCRICAIIVAYRPNHETLSALLEACLDQCTGVILINNSRPKDLDIPQHPHLHLVQLESNIGIAGAQNLGVTWASDNRYSHVVFFDQDSQPAKGLVATLVAAFETLEMKGERPAAVGPSLIDNRDGIVTPFVRFRFWGIERILPSEGHPLINCDFLISSGLLTSIERFQTIGPWEDALFVDNVDMEWSFRARSQGFHCFGVSTAQLSHSLGEQVFRLKIFRWHLSIYTHPPPRQYYINRNRIALYRRPYVPLTWKVQDVPRGFLKSALICLIFPPRLENLQSIFHGILDGLRDRLGARHGNPQQAPDQGPPQFPGHHLNDPRTDEQRNQPTSGASRANSR